MKELFPYLCLIGMDREASYGIDILAMLLGMVKEYDSSMRYGARLTLLKKLFPVLHLIAIETGLQYTLAKDHLMKDL